MAFAKIYETNLTQILVTKEHPNDNEEGVYAVALTIEGKIDGVLCTLKASASQPDMDEERMNELFDAMSEVKAINMCNELFGTLLDEKLKPIGKPTTRTEPVMGTCPECDKETPIDEIETFNGICESCRESHE